jgi:C-terminal processing protease CtpA/Prc
MLLHFVSVNAQQNMNFERERHRGMLDAIKNDIKKNYYDTNFKGIDLEASYKAADEKLKQAASIGQMSGIIAQFMLDFDDSHLFFLPPGKVNKTDYGFEMRMIGDKCMVVKLDEKSDAAQKGLKIGDQIYSLEGFAPDRASLWKMEYFFNRLRPRPSLKLEVIKPDGKTANIETLAKITQGKQIMDATGGDLNQLIREDEDAYYKSVKQYFYEKVDGLFVWKMPHFSLDPTKVDDIMDKAKKSQAMILDLRGNGGGRVDMVLRLIGNFFPENLKVYDEKSRKETKEIIAKSRGKNAYTGKLIVLIDSDSASASEIFSRVVQLEKRGTIIGDRSAGAVMESRYYGHQSGMDVVAFYGASVTIADLIMKDGKSLEKLGVTPDEKVIPAGKDLAEKRDVVLSKAVESLGFKLSPEDAGKIFPNEYDR